VNTVSNLAQVVSDILWPRLDKYGVPASFLLCENGNAAVRKPLGLRSKAFPDSLLLYQRRKGAQRQRCYIRRIPAHATPQWPLHWSRIPSMRSRSLRTRSGGSPDFKALSSRASKTRGASRLSESLSAALRKTKPTQHDSEISVHSATPASNESESSCPGPPSSSVFGSSRSSVVKTPSNDTSNSASSSGFVSARQERTAARRASLVSIASPFGSKGRNALFRTSPKSQTSSPRTPHPRRTECAPPRTSPATSRRSRSSHAVCRRVWPKR